MAAHARLGTAAAVCALPMCGCFMFDMVIGVCMGGTLPEECNNQDVTIFSIIVTYSDSIVLTKEIFSYYIDLLHSLLQNWNGVLMRGGLFRL